MPGSDESNHESEEGDSHSVQVRAHPFPSLDVCLPTLQLIESGGSAMSVLPLPVAMLVLDTRHFTMSDIRALERRQKLILHRLEKVCAALTKLRGFVGQVRDMQQVQNDILHKVELPIDTLRDSYLVAE